MSTQTVATINGTHFEGITEKNRDTLAVGDEVLVRNVDDAKNELHEITDETMTQLIIETGERYSKLTGQRIAGTGTRIDSKHAVHIFGRATAPEVQHGIKLGDVHPGDIIKLVGETVDVIATAKTIDKQFVHITWKTVAEGLVMSDRFAVDVTTDRYVRMY